MRDLIIARIQEMAKDFPDALVEFDTDLDEVMVMDDADLLDLYTHIIQDYYS